MKEFMKFTFASLLGVILAGIVFTILGIISMVGMVASSDTETVVKENSIFVLNLEGTLSERVQENPFQKLLGEENQAYGLDDILSSIRKAKDNENIKGIYLQPTSLSTSFASLEEIRHALVDFKGSGKFIVAYADQYTQSMYYLASVADKVIVNPQGTISWHGLASQPVFFKDLLNKLGIEMQIFKVGTYKSAVEPYIATEMSEANREQVTAFLTSIWGRLLEDVSASRNIPKETLNNYADQMMDLKQAEEYLTCGLADTLLYKDGVLNYLKELSGREADESLRTLSLNDMKNVKRNTPLDKSGNIIAVYYAFGGIDDGTSPEEGINSEKVITDLRKLREDETIKAVVLRVNSPGGSAYGSEQIWHEVVLLKAKKPVIVSMGDYAASGGYYISCAADTIVADPTTLTGSIGIFGMFPNMQGLLTDKIGLHFDMVKTNRFSDMGDMTRPFNADEREAMQNYINNGYKLFVKRCADGRGMSTEAIEKIAEGRVWTGEAAKELGLVDELGGLDRALEIAAQKVGIEAYSVVNYPAKESFFSTLLDEGKNDYIETKMSESLGEYFHYVKFIQNLKDTDRIQARMPFDPRIQ
ncbi:MAG: signal peptide peptidase SppA [Bacteroidaceae bacterium]|nr:signal peptide peptidase SppA [Bacteroidaceae bacterium]MBQ4057082.1 signal peptide peptidase SppA [Bacteroidaceae bacterium]